MRCPRMHPGSFSFTVQVGVDAFQQHFNHNHMQIIVEAKALFTILIIRLPEQSKTKQSWLKFLRLANSAWMWQPAQNMYVCGHHFTTKFVLSGAAGKTRIAADGFPTLKNKECVPEMKVTST